MNAAKAIKSAAANHVATSATPSVIRSDHSGTCDRTMIRGSVISSIAYFSPSRPNPESFGAAVRHLVGAERR